MWNKRLEDSPPGRAPVEPVREPVRVPLSGTAPVAAAAMGAPGAVSVPAVIGASMHIKGEIRSREELVVDGEVEGVLESQSTITVGPNGRVNANIKAREVEIFGKVKGNVEVSDKLAIREQGSLIGDIKTAGISIDDGAYFKGSIDIIRPEPLRAQKGPQVSEPAATAADGSSR